MLQSLGSLLCFAGCLWACVNFSIWWSSESPTNGAAVLVLWIGTLFFGALSLVFAWDALRFAREYHLDKLRHDRLVYAFTHISEGPLDLLDPSEKIMISDQKPMYIKPQTQRIQ